MDNIQIQAMKSAHKIISSLLAVKPGEDVLIGVDPATDVRMTNALCSAVEICGAEFSVLMMPVRGKDKARTVTKPYEAALEKCDVHIGMTRASGASIYIPNIKTLMDAKKIRECSIVMRDINNFTKGGALADYEKIYADGLALQKIWRGKKEAKVTTPAGTDVTMQMVQMEPIIECGVARNFGEAMAFSDGEVSIGPIPHTMNGIIAIDGPICYYGQTANEPIKLKIVNGRVSEILSGDPKICKELRRLFDEVENAVNIAEIGIGLNPSCLFNGDFEEEKKARGTVHFALGDGNYYGQSKEDGSHSQVHIDMIQYNPTIYFDDMLIEKDGKVVCLGDK